MPSYYEVLKLESTAPVQEIELAIDEHYNQFRHLVNHHDPNVVEQANRALRQLEDIRSTLTNPEKRALYDQTLNFGGLVDPSALAQSAGAVSGPMTPPPPKPAVADDVELKAWNCDQCGKSNRVGSKICSNCGNVLARDCPNLCGNVVLLSEKYCSSCGKSVEEALARLQMEFEQAQKRAVDDLRTKLQSKRNEVDRLNWFADNIPFWGTNQELNSLVGETINAGLGCGLAFALFFAANIALSVGAAIGGEGGGGFLAFVFFIAVLGGGFVFLRSAFVKPRFRAAIDRAAHQRQEYIRHAERRFQEEQAKQFDPLSPKPYSPTIN